MPEWDIEQAHHYIQRVLYPFTIDWTPEFPATWIGDRLLPDQIKHVSIVTAMRLDGGSPGIGAQWLPPFLCPKCCLYPDSRGRLNLVVVRNPFIRFVASFQWMGGDPSDFPKFVDWYYDHWLEKKYFANAQILFLNLTHRSPVNFTHRAKPERKKFDADAFSHYWSQLSELELG